MGYRQLRDFLHCWEGLAPKGRGVCTYIRIGVRVPCAIRKLNTCSCKGMNGYGMFGLLFVVAATDPSTTLWSTPSGLPPYSTLAVPGTAFVLKVLLHCQWCCGQLHNATRY